MKSHFFHSFVSLIFIMCLLFLGIGLCILPQSPDWTMHLSEMLKNNPSKCALIGKYLLASGGALLLFFYFLGRKSDYHLKVEPGLSYSVKKQVIEKSITDLLEEMRPEGIPFKLNIYGQNIEMIADLSKISFEAHEALLDNLESKLSELMQKTYGEPKEFNLSIVTSKA